MMDVRGTGYSLMKMMAIVFFFSKLSEDAKGPSSSGAGI